MGEIVTDYNTDVKEIGGQIISFNYNCFSYLYVFNLLTHSVLTLGWHMIVSNFDICILILVIDGLESAVVGEDFMAIWLLSSSLLIIVSIEIGLSWLQNGVGLVSNDC